YFIGIGSSNTGGRSEDMEKAREKAIASLAASISVQIDSEHTFVSREDSRGGFFESAESRITETVNQHIKLLEVVDTYYSKELGYWYYVRLNKKEWRELQQKETAELRERVGALIQSVQWEKDNTVSISEVLSVLWKGWHLLVSSPYGSSIRMDEGGTSDYGLDMLEKKINFINSLLFLTVEPEDLQFEKGEIPRITIGVKSKGQELGFKNPPGSFRIKLEFKDSDGPRSMEVLTDNNGVYNGSLDLLRVSAETIKVHSSLTLEQFNIKPDLVPKGIMLPEKDFTVTVVPVTLGFRVEVKGYDKHDSVYNSLLSIFLSRLPYKLDTLSSGLPELNGSTGKTTLLCSLYYRDVPKNDYGIAIVYARAVISLVKSTKVLFSFETEEMKEGGLDSDQARDRATQKLLKAIDNDKDLIEHLLRAVLDALGKKE
ncbi:MAG: hypothetical protein AB1798_24510, partial [Spirochaetota bacterium]